jgi:hypothetical protein
MTEVQVSPQAAVEQAQAPHPNLSPEEWAALRAEDRQAGAAIVGIMATIFILGLVGYTVICLVAWG